MKPSNSESKTGYLAESLTRGLNQPSVIILTSRGHIQNLRYYCENIFYFSSSESTSQTLDYPLRSFFGAKIKEEKSSSSSSPENIKKLAQRKGMHITSSEIFDLRLKTNENSELWFPYEAFTPLEICDVFYSLQRNRINRHMTHSLRILSGEHLPFKRKTAVRWNRFIAGLAASSHAAKLPLYLTTRMPIMAALLYALEASAGYAFSSLTDSELGKGFRKNFWTRNLFVILLDCYNIDEHQWEEVLSKEQFECVNFKAQSQLNDQEKQKEKEKFESFFLNMSSTDLTGLAHKLKHQAYRYLPNQIANSLSSKLNPVMTPKLRNSVSKFIPFLPAASIAAEAGVTFQKISLEGADVIKRCEDFWNKKFSRTNGTDQNSRKPL